MNQKEIIQQCKKNEYSAQLEVYNTYKHLLYNSCYRILKDKHYAEDVVQDAFIKGFQKIDQINDEGNLAAWFRRIAINMCLDSIRKEKKTVWVEETLILETAYELEDELSANDRISIDFIKTCIDQLTDKYRVILVLYLIEDYTHKEIAELLDLKESTVRNQYARGKKILLETIENHKKNGYKGVFTAT